MTAPLLRIEHLEVRYGDLIGVSDVSLDVPEGSVVALLGSNGGGKTTTLNAIAGLIPVHSGSIIFRGEQLVHGEAAQNFCILARLSDSGGEVLIFHRIGNDNEMSSDARRPAFCGAKNEIWQQSLKGAERGPMDRMHYDRNTGTGGSKASKNSSFATMGVDD